MLILMLLNFVLWMRGARRHLLASCSPLSWGRRVGPQNVAQKTFEHERCPDRRAPVTHSALMLVDDLSQACDIEQPGFGKRGSQERLADPGSQRASEPLSERNGKTHLGAVHQLVQQV